MTCCQKSKKNAYHSWLPTINLDVLKLEANSTQTHTKTKRYTLKNNGQHVEEHNILYITSYI